MPIVTLQPQSYAPSDGLLLPRQINVGPPGKSGGEGAIYFTPDGKYAVKIYHQPRQDKAQKLRYVMTLFQHLPPEQGAFILPPLALVEAIDGRPCVGFVMRQVPSSHKELLDFVLNPVMAAQQFQRGKTWAHYLKVARGVANAIFVLHNKGCGHTDVHYRNFLVNFETSETVMLEIDGVVVPGFLVPEVMGVRGFIAPEVLIGGVPPSEKTDRYSLAVLILHTLLFRNVMEPLLDYADDEAQSELLAWGKHALFSEHPQDRRHRPRNVGVPLYQNGALSYRILTPLLRQLTDQAFLAGLHAPERRPIAKEWVDALAACFDELYMCVRCRQYFPYPHWVSPAPRRVCPFCAQPCRAPLPVVLDLLEERSRHSYLPIGRSVVLGHGFRLFADVITPGRIPPASRRNEPVAGHVEWDTARRSYRLVNTSGGEWTARPPGGQPVVAHQGESLPLVAGSTIHLGEERRLMLVKETP